MLRKIFMISSVIILCSSMAQARPAQDEELVNLQDEIKAYNLVNGLYLEAGQMEFILRAAEDAQAKKKTLESRFENDCELQKRALSELKDELRENKGEVSADIARQVHMNTTQNKKLQKEYRDFLKSKAQAVQAILNESQLFALQNFKPCLVPPKGAARIGQDDSGERLADFLERVRGIPDARYAQRKSVIAERYVQRVSEHLPEIAEDDITRIKNTLLLTLDNVRRLSDVDFMMEKETIARELKEKTLPPRRAFSVEESISRFLLQPGIIAVLKEKLARENTCRKI
ncbi:MAG: hypothetical protein KJ893_06930 [Candidatus Omnitrophica bacterium]|nr:hypothetical protein [Candidatus Omnitrophota bacterium]MBU4478569.1 hypothetical protein [Candidatus Omnitrophota bacterium]MCG2703567.1 hypothetical protein [Candidatus Omnitrophota bacterium]